MFNRNTNVEGSFLWRGRFWRRNETRLDQCWLSKGNFSCNSKLELIRVKVLWNSCSLILLMLPCCVKTLVMHMQLEFSSVRLNNLNIFLSEKSLVKWYFTIPHKMQSDETPSCTALAATTLSTSHRCLSIDHGTIRLRGCIDESLTTEKLVWRC